MKINHSYWVLLIASILLIGRSDLVKAQNSEINSSKNNKTMTFEKVALPYATDALEADLSANKPSNSTMASIIRPTWTIWINL